MSDKFVALMVIFLVLAFFFLGIIVGVKATKITFHKEAVKRGHAEWIMPPDPSREKPVWRWKGEEQDDE
jgi:hypothetical protein